MASSFTHIVNQTKLEWYKKTELTETPNIVKIFITKPFVK